MDLRIRQLKCFLALAETLHFGRAAQQLYMSQPALTFQIQAMEAAIGMPLFDRNRRRVQLTDAGKNLVTAGSRILGELRAFQESLTLLAAEQPLRVVCAPAGEQVVLPFVIRRLSELAPQTRLDLVGLPPIRHVTALQEHEIDVLLMVRRVDARGVTFQRLSEQRIYAVVPAESKYAKRGSISVREFAEHPILVASREYCDKTQRMIEHLLEPYDAKPRFVEAPGRQSVQEAMVAAGIGVALNTEWRLLVPFPGVKMIPFEEKLPALELGAAWRSSCDSEAMHAFRTALEDAMLGLDRGNLRMLPRNTKKTAAVAIAS